MKTLAAPLVVLAAALVGWAGPGPPAAPADALDLVLPGDAGRVRLHLAVEGPAPAARWGAFLDSWLDYFDRDGNGWLSRAEAERIVALPGADGREAAFDFGRADADRDGKVSRAEVKTFYRGAGFTPVRAVVAPPAVGDLQVSAALFQHLGAGADGSLTAEQMGRAGELLRKLDEDEDEVLTPAEVLSLGAGTPPGTPRSALRWLAPADQPTVGTVRLALGTDKAPVLRVEKGRGPAVRVLPGDAAPRVRCGDVVLTFNRAPDVASQAAAQSRQFLVAQFKSAAGSRAWVDRAQLADDAGLQILADLFAPGDRDADGKLTLTELERFLGLLERGAACSLTVTLTDRGRDLFTHLDMNTDGRLDRRELSAAARVLGALEGAGEQNRIRVPHLARVTVQAGHVGSAFGPLPLFAAPAPTAGRPTAAAKGPAWFRATDRNGDGYLSPAEFLGPADLFRRLDRDGDGLISAAEAEAGGQRRQR